MRGLFLDFGIEREEAFTSPRSRKWYFATHKPTAPGTTMEKRPNRWGDIIAAARDATRVQPGITGEELIGAVNNSLNVTLTPSEEDRVRKLVETGRQKSFVGPPERVPKEEKTPEISEIIEQEWARLQEEKEKEMEKQKEKAKAPKSVNLSVPALGQPGMYMTGSSKMRSQESYLLDKYPCMSDADHWRAFQQAVQLVRSWVEDADIKDEITEEYPEVDALEILKAAKGFVKEGSKDPYVNGREYAEQLTGGKVDKAAVVATYADMVWQQGNSLYLKGFKAGLPGDVLRSVNRV